MAPRLLRGIAFAIVAAFVLTSCAGTPGPETSPEGPVTLAPIDPADIVTPEELEAMGYEGDGMTIEHHDLTTAISQRYGADMRFSGFEWDRDIGVLRLWWFGDVPPSLTETLADSGIPVEIAPTVHSPAELRDAVRRVTAPGAIPSIFVTSAGADIDCSKLTVTVEALPAGMTHADVSTAISAVAGFPVDVTIGSVMPISDLASAIGS